MQPAILLSRIIRERNLKLTDILRDYILYHEGFRSLAESVEEDPINKTMQAVEFIESRQGSCPKCKGKAVWRNGVHFDNQKRCNICKHVWEP